MEERRFLLLKLFDYVFFSFLFVLDNSNDLFANAPMPTLNQENDIDKTIDILTSGKISKCF